MTVGEYSSEKKTPGQRVIRHDAGDERVKSTNCRSAMSRHKATCEWMPFHSQSREVTLGQATDHECLRLQHALAHSPGTVLHRKLNISFDGAERYAEIRCDDAIGRVFEQGCLERLS